MNQKLLDKIEEIKEIAINTSGDSKDDEMSLLRIIATCDQILTDHKTTQQLERLEQLNERH